jgi:hypothetical protein
MSENAKNNLAIIFVLLLSAGQLLCAFGSLRPVSPDPLSDGLINAANILNGTIGIMVLLPKLRKLAACLSVLITSAYMARNYFIIGYDYFLEFLPFDLLLLGLSLYVFFYYRRKRVASVKDHAV